MKLSPRKALLALPELPVLFYLASSPALAQCVNTVIGCIPTDTRNFIGWVLGIAATLGALCAIILIIVGGYTILASTGDPQQLMEGRQIITAAITGLLFILVSGFILHIIGVDLIGITSWIY